MSDITKKIVSFLNESSPDMSLIQAKLRSLVSKETLNKYKTKNNGFIKWTGIPFRSVLSKVDLDELKAYRDAFKKDFLFKVNIDEKRKKVDLDFTVKQAF